MFDQQHQQQQDGGSDNIKVVVRVRPLFPNEAGKGGSNVISVGDDFQSLKVCATLHCCLVARLSCQEP